MQKHTFHTCD